MPTPRTHTRQPLSHYSIVWDLLIGLTLCVGAAMAWAGFGLMHISPLFGILGILGILGIFLTLYGSFVEPKRITLNTKIIQKENFPTLNIAIASDMHVGPYKGRRFLAKVVDHINAQKPDVILLPGDFLYDYHSSISDLEPLKKLSAPLGIFAVVGNHDSGQHHYKSIFGNELRLSYPDRTDDLAAFFAQTNITLLRNEARTITHNNQSISVGGVDDAWMPSFDLTKTIDAVDTSLPSILLSHNPDAVGDEHIKEVDLVVSGHTHGGQIRLPLIGPLRRTPSMLDEKFDHGLYQLSDNTTLAITHGLGEVLVRARLFCPPEIMILNINSSARTSST